jgi:hypothetical protein
LKRAQENNPAAFTPAEAGAYKQQKARNGLNGEDTAKRRRGQWPPTAIGSHKSTSPCGFHKVIPRPASGRIASEPLPEIDREKIKIFSTARHGQP